MERHVTQQQARQRHRLHVVETGRRRRNRQLPRQRRKRAKPSGLRQHVASLREERQQVARGRLHGSPERQQAGVSRGLDTVGRARQHRPRPRQFHRDQLREAAANASCRSPPSACDLVQGETRTTASCRRARAYPARCGRPHRWSQAFRRCGILQRRQRPGAPPAARPRAPRTPGRMSFRCRAAAAAARPRPSRSPRDRGFRESVRHPRRRALHPAALARSVHPARRGRGHARHPFRIFSHCASATLAACGVVEIFVGHGRVKPSLGHFRVASMPILLP